MSQLHEVTERHRFDVERLLRYLKDRLPGFSGPLQVRQFQGGQSNPTFRLEAAFSFCSNVCLVTVLTIVSTCCPSLKKRMLGMDRIPYLTAMS